MFCVDCLRYAQKEADTIAKIKAEQERANQIAAKAAQTRGESVAPVRTISDEQLKMIHKTVKTRLATKFSNVKEIFKSMDMDRSGTISPEVYCLAAALYVAVVCPLPPVTVLTAHDDPGMR